MSLGTDPPRRRRLSSRHEPELHRRTSGRPCDRAPGDADRITHASEKTARRSGLNLMVFSDFDEAVAWLTA
jgi:hypothetical protein